MAIALETITDQHNIERITKGMSYEIKDENSDCITVRDNQNKLLNLDKERYFDVNEEEE